MRKNASIEAVISEDSQNVHDEIQLFGAVPSYNNIFKDVSGEFPLAYVQFTGNHINVAAASKGNYGNATSVTIRIMKKDWLGIYNQVVAEKTFPVDSNGYSICAGTLVPTNQELQIIARVNGTPQLSTANVSIIATSSTY